MSNKQIGALYQAHKHQISKQRSIPETGMVDSDDLDKVSNRAALMALLDITLEEHRVKYSSTLNPLRGRKALTHLILTKYKWPIDTISKMSLSDSILAIQDELFSPNSSELSKEHLKNINAQYFCQVFEDMPESDWDPVIHESYLSLRD
ncbi:ECs1072 family phage-associated protein [Erwinia persicina]|uniref:ECs1072 family phage-associated protein n=1 Tax=Erwinia persicina TaxID=55211 RepID=UPI0007873BA9|nr:hypothetical protein [Erwinia persicina]